MIVLVAIVLACLAADARAQSEAVIGLGLAVTTNDPTGPLGNSATDIGPLLRLNLGPGIGPTIGFDWFEIGVRAMAGTTAVHLGSLRVRPIMAGVTYNWNRGRYWLGASFVAGYAFARLTVDDRARPAFQAALHTSYLSFEASDSFVWRPQIGVWYDAAPRVGITANLAYIGVRPMLRTTTDSGTLTSRLDAASTVLTFGLVYGVF